MAGDSAGTMRRNSSPSSMPVGSATFASLSGANSVVHMKPALPCDAPPTTTIDLLTGVNVGHCCVTWH